MAWPNCTLNDLTTELNGQIISIVWGAPGVSRHVAMKNNATRNRGYSHSSGSQGSLRHHRFNEPWFLTSLTNINDDYVYFWLSGLLTIQSWLINNGLLSTMNPNKPLLIHHDSSPSSIFSSRPCQMILPASTSLTNHNSPTNTAATIINQLINHDLSSSNEY